jgi:uncharacterized protein (UPF0335 family)
MPRKTTKTTRTERISQFTTPVDDETLDFIQAIERFKSERNRAFPSWTDVLQVLKGLGYEKKGAPPPRP